MNRKRSLVIASGFLVILTMILVTVGSAIRDAYAQSTSQNDRPYSVVATNDGRRIFVAGGGKLSVWEYDMNGARLTHRQTVNLPH